LLIAILPTTGGREASVNSAVQYTDGKSQNQHDGKCFTSVAPAVLESSGVGGRRLFLPSARHTLLFLLLMGVTALAASKFEKVLGTCVDVEPALVICLSKIYARKIFDVVYRFSISIKDQIAKFSTGQHIDDADFLILKNISL